jgi:hypothetical protein
MSTYGKNGGNPVQAEGLTLPPMNQAVQGWTMPGAAWLLYAEPPVLLQCQTEQGPWRVAARFSDRPVAVVLLGQKHLVVLRTKPTKTPEKGIPYVVEETLDGGKTWRPFAVPPVDYPLGMVTQNGILVMSGIRLPKGGLPSGTDWFELPRTTFVSSDEGRHFTQMVGPSFFDIGAVEARSVAPDGKRRVYLRDVGFRDAYYEVYLIDQPDGLPRRIYGADTRPEPTWSPKSDLLGFTVKGKLANAYDLKTRRLEGQPVMNIGEPSSAEKVKQAEWEQKAQASLQGGKVGWDNLKADER